jgi:uncharacterized protein YjbJ (UPF0337 family)
MQMNNTHVKRTHVEAAWLAVKGQFQSSWQQLSQEDIQAAFGKRSLLVTKIEEKYGLSKAQAENALKNWEIQHRSFL